VSSVIPFLQLSSKHARFEVLTAMKIHVVVLWVAMQKDTNVSYV
jgi:hypothetical protein